MIRPSTLIKHSPGSTPGHAGNWRDDAACAGQIDDWVYFDHGKNDEIYALAEARRSCDICPVRAQCLEFAIETGQAGIWGGETEEERKRIRRRRDRKSEAKEKIA